MTGASSFDARATTWDDDPAKRRRAAAVADAIRAEVPLSKAMRAMEFGAGTGLLSFELAAELGSILLIDTSTGMLEVARAKIAARGASHLSVLASDLTRDQPPGDRFDLVFSMMTFHHVPDTDDLLRRLFARIAPGGWLCVADLDAEDGSFHGSDVDVHHGFERAALGRSLVAAGFEDVRFRTCFEIARDARRYSVFLSVAQHPR